MTNYEVKLISGPSPYRYRGLIKHLKPLRYYRLDETTGTTAIDEMGVFNGNIVGGPTLGEPGLISNGTSMLFNGESATPRIDAGGPILNNDVTICAWIRPIQKSGGRSNWLFGMTQGSSFLAARLLPNTRILSFRISTPSVQDLNSGVTLQDNVSYFVAFRRNSSSRNIWLNDQLVAQSTVATAWETPTGVFRIGCINTNVNNFFYGHIDEFAIFDKYLTDTQLSEIYEEGYLTPLSHIADLVNARCTSIEHEPHTQGVARVTLPTSDIAVNGIKTKGRREIQVWRNDKKIFEGPVWTIYGDSKNTFLNVEPITSYLAKRHIEETLDYNETDIYNILWGLLEYTQNKGTLGISAANFLPIGINRTANYPDIEHATIGDLLLDFPEVDWSIEIYDDGRREWTPYYPKRGDIREQDVLEWGGLVVDYRYAYHSIESANKVHWLGKGNATERAVGSYHDPALSDLNVYTTKIRTDWNVEDENILNEMSKQLVQVGGIDEMLPDLMVANNPQDPNYDFIGSLKTGDIFPVNLEHDGRVIMSGMFRLTKIFLQTETDSAWLTFEKYVS